MIPVTTFAGKNVAVFGLGASGNITAQALMAGGATVSAWDDGTVGREGAGRLGIPLEDLSAADWGTFSALVLAPGVPLTHPEPHWVVLKARAAGVEVIGDIELFCRERNALCPEAPFIAITGTNGKSTTTALIAHILREAGKDVQMGGNIGRPILDLEPLTGERFYVIEMSSFQIDLTPSVNPTVGVLLNITPDHLDRHGPADDLHLAMKNYAAIKERLLLGAKLAVIGADTGLSTNTVCDLIYHDLYDHKGKPIKAFVHGRAQATNVVWFDPPHLRRELPIGGNHCAGEVLTDLSNAPTLRGAHNAENAAAAFLACEWLEVPHDVIGTAMRSYPGLPHRMEEIGRVGNVYFVNDSKATNADSTEKALLTFPHDVFWILGGKPKEGGIASLAAYFPGIAKAYLIGAASDEFAATLEGKVPYERCGTLDVAVAKAAADALAANLPSSVVLLSPACASYDQFKNFEVRGEAFRSLVSALPGFIRRGERA